MPEEKKFTEEEMKQVQTFQRNYVSIQSKFGQLKMAQIRLDEQEVDLENALTTVQEKEQEFLDGITKKYGEGSLNQETGVFTPNKSE